MAKRKNRVHGTVRWFDVEEGWGILDSPGVPGGCFVHFSNIVGVGYWDLDDGQEVSACNSSTRWRSTQSLE